MTRCTDAPSTRHRRLSGWLPGLLALLSLAAFSPVSAAPAGIDWQIVNYSLDLTWNSVAYGNGRFVAVAASGTGNRVMTSPDGIAWTVGASAADSSWSSVTYGNGRFVAVANSGTGNRVMTSPDGIAWTGRNAAAASGWSSVTYGNGRFVAVGSAGAVMTSTDGSTWTTSASPDVNLSWKSVTYGNGLFVAVANSGTGKRVMTSPDGITWTAYASANDTLSWQSATYSNGLFVAVGSAGAVMTSTDGSSWATRTAAANDAWRSVTYGNGLFVAVGSAGAVMTSTNGTTWTTRTAAAANNWTSVTYSNGLFAAVAATGSGNRIMTSPDGSAWTAQTYPPDQAWDAVTYGNGLFVAVACGVAISQVCNTSVGNRVMTSPDGLTWTARTTPAADSPWTAVTYGNGQFVAVAQSGTSQVLTSPDGIAWTARTAAANNTWRSVTYGNGRFVAVAIGTGTNQVMTSPDGITWTAQTAAAAVDWSSVAYGNNRFVAVASGGTGKRVMTSPDGITWTAYASANDNLSWQSATYGNGLFVVVGSAGAVMTSPDGSTWTTRTAAAAINWTSVTYGDDLFVAVASSGVGNRVMTSPDGVTWTARTAAANNMWTSVTYGNSLFVAVAWSGAGNRVMLSRNPCGVGISLPTARWQQLALPCTPSASPASVVNVLGNDPTANLPAASYTSQWLMYQRSLSAGAYATLAGTSPLALGAGYWIKSLQAPVGGQLTVAGSDTPVATGVAGCQSATGCFIAPVYLSGQPLGTKLIGNPFPYEVDWSQVRVRVNGLDTLTPSEAQDANLLSNQLWVWNGTGYDTWSDRVPNQGSLPYFKAFWVKVLPGGTGQTIELLIPAEISSVGAPTPGSGEWLVRLKAGSAQGGWNTQVRLGQWTGAATGYDPADLSAMVPFASPYLTLAFPQPSWGTRKGDYASDFRPADGQAGQWLMDLRADPVGSQVVLTWEGDPAILANSRLLDGATVIDLANYPDGYPLTLSGKVRRLTWEYLGGNN